MGKRGSLELHLFELLRELVAELPEVSEKYMFGSDALFAAGAIFAIVWDGRIGVKLTAPDEFSALLASGADRWSPTGKSMGGWLLVPEELHDDPEALRPWVERAHRAGLQAGFAKRAKSARAPAPAKRPARPAAKKGAKKPARSRTRPAK